jgi:predicted peptidase
MESAQMHDAGQTGALILKAHSSMQKALITMGKRFPRFIVMSQPEMQCRIIGQDGEPTKRLTNRSDQSWPALCILFLHGCAA